MNEDIREMIDRVKNIDQFVNEQKNDNFYGLFSRTKRTRTNVILDDNTINELILNDDVLKNNVEYVTDRGGFFILLIKQDYDTFNKLLKFRIENELGLVFDKITTDKNMLS